MTPPAPQHCEKKEYCNTCSDFKKGMVHGESGMGMCSYKNRGTISWQQWCILRDMGCASHSAIRTRPHAAPSPANKALIFIPKPSDELIVLAEKEWTNRAERKGRYEKASWITGWLEGYFSKPVNIVQHDAAIRNATLDEVKQYADTCIWIDDDCCPGKINDKEESDCDGCSYVDYPNNADICEKIESLRKQGEP